MLKSILFLTLFIGAFSKPTLISRNSKEIFSDYFNSVEWITRDGVISISIDHKTVPLLQISKAFAILESEYSSDANWKNRDSLYAQFVCHAQFAPSKNPWNLEPSRTTTGWLATTLNKCNPSKFLYSN